MSQLASNKQPIRRRELPTYETNPSMQVVSDKTKIGTRHIPNREGDKLMVIDADGTVIADAGFHEIIEVDRTQFIKFYVDGVTLFNGLSSPGTKVFKIVYKFVISNPNTYIIYMHHKDTTLGKATFDRGLTELLANEIIYKSTKPNLFYLNVNYMFNGNRLALVKEYRLKGYVGRAKKSTQPPPFLE